MSNAMRLGCSAYGLLLLLYPQDLRSRYSGEMKLVFREQLQGELMRRGASGAARVALLAVWEVVSVAAPLQLRNPTVIAAALSIVTSSILVLTFFRAVSPGCGK
jgi:hypothetical protein